jgi:hypothetical protein
MIFTTSSYSLPVRIKKKFLLQTCVNKITDGENAVGENDFYSSVTASTGYSWEKMLLSP